MDIEIHKNNLKKYIEEDMAFKEPLKNISDFDKYCYNHCLDIKEVLSELDKKDKIINEMLEHILIHCGDLAETFCEGKNENQCKARFETYNCHYCIKEYFTKKVETNNTKI